ncbi:putative tRNA pseudouridine synthase Pus10 [Maniola hyperantus]|uniref:putative tRNA pseudouridine synthase Pus10 n=1 Tax=Aphantopus hyperantus TaxID=2795564 RepID=UPI001568654A|nr:tRNA pseudouridine synthase Pus10 [Maniola hyperantus]
MNPKAVYKYCKHLGCCDACCLRYIGIKNPNAYENVANFVIKYQDDNIKSIRTEQSQSTPTNSKDTKQNILDVSKNDIQNINGNTLDVDGKDVSHGVDDSPPCKKRRLDVCVSCLSILQQDNWTEGYVLVKDVLFKKRYECKTFACALSAPIATLLRERAITLRLAEEFPGYDDKTLTALKEAWKWSFGVRLAAEIDKTLDSGAISPLLVTLNYDYADDLQELEILKQVSPQLFEERSKQKRRFVTEFTRRSVEQALDSATLSSLRAAGGGGGLPAVAVRAMCIGAVCTHAPMYLAGRYIKLSRNLPQSPWILDGKRVLPSSVQEIIYKPLADFYNLEAEEAERRLKLIAAGREDVDVRCLGEGRPFAIEITDPTRQLTPEELANACEDISKGGEVIVKQIVPISREDLVQLKKGEETKSKTYEALCIKLSHSIYDDVSPDSPIKVTPEDIARINSFRNTPQNINPAQITAKNYRVSSKPVCKTSKNIMDIVDNLKLSKNLKSDSEDNDKNLKSDSEDNDKNLKSDSEDNDKNLKSDSEDNDKNLKSDTKDNDKNIDMDTCENVLDTSKAENRNYPEISKDTKMETNVNIPDVENPNLENSTVENLYKSNGVLKTENIDNSEGVKNTELVTSVKVKGAEILDTNEDSGVQNENPDITESLKDTGDVLDTTDEATESEILDSPGEVKITIQQRTPIRVLHRRPLLTRTRQILELKAVAVPDHPQLFRISVRTSAGTYVKEWAHGELGRSRPALGDAVGAAVDMLALDVTAVHLTWPPSK